MCVCCELCEDENSPGFVRVCVCVCQWQKNEQQTARWSD